MSWTILLRKHQHCLPALDYVIVKMPRWNFDKFKGADATLGLQMKSVGEVMAIVETSKKPSKKLVSL